TVELPGNGARQERSVLFQFSEPGKECQRGEVRCKFNSLLKRRAIMSSRKLFFVAITTVAFLLMAVAARDHSFAGTPGSRDSDREAIRAVLNAQQAAWNRGDVEAFVVGYWHSPELTFSGSSGVSRGWDGVLARYKKNYPDRATMGE